MAKAEAAMRNYLRGVISVSDITNVPAGVRRVIFQLEVLEIIEYFF